MPDAFEREREREIGSRILSATTRYMFAVILENDNGKYLLVPEKKDANLSNAKSAIKRMLTKTGLPPALVGTMKYVDFNALIEFGLFRRKPDVTEYFAKKQKDLPLTIDNVEFEAEKPEDAFEDYTQIQHRHHYRRRPSPIPPYAEACPSIRARGPSWVGKGTS